MMLKHEQEIFYVCEVHAIRMCGSPLPTPSKKGNARTAQGQNIDAILYPETLFPAVQTMLFSR